MKRRWVWWVPVFAVFFVVSAGCNEDMSERLKRQVEYANGLVQHVGDCDKAAEYVENYTAKNKAWMEAERKKSGGAVESKKRVGAPSTLGGSHAPWFTKLNEAQMAQYQKTSKDIGKVTGKCLGLLKDPKAAAPPPPNARFKKALKALHGG